MANKRGACSRGSRETPEMVWTNWNAKNRDHKAIKINLTNFEMAISYILDTVQGDIS